MAECLPVMIQGTHSDAGKSILVTALCRIYADEGYRTAPFKSQNMALNSYITTDGKEIGRAQGVQAEAAGIPATTWMNPILIKPSGDRNSQIVVHGKPFKNMKAGEYREDFYKKGLKLIEESYNRLAAEFERIVIEGAGSPAEINLNDRELVNMSVAKMAKAPVVLVGDIDKGGVFASLAGTLQLLESEDRNRVIGVIINKFRGDRELLEPGLDWFETYTGLPVLGVIPHIPNLNIEAEDSLALEHQTVAGEVDKEIDIAVICYPRVSNFTDADPLMKELDCQVRFVRTVNDLGKPDLVILPGSKNTLSDMQWLQTAGMAEQVKLLAETACVIGICGGYQMLGRQLEDPEEVESSSKRISGLGLIKEMSTVLLTSKKTVLSRGKARYGNHNLPVSGYEIHMGISSYESKENSFFIELDSGEKDGYISPDGRLIGTYFHGIFENDQFRSILINELRQSKGLPPLYSRPAYNQIKEEAFSRLAGTVKNHLNMELLEEEIRKYQMKVRGRAGK
ncbi:cobyric acid synthase [Salipaludibacillus aurantiacus]|uniref:Cobyric acid synthase n=1 Tax=Salipaludibacillus aurantiacus TaxID=1601833 RepID=A0A1H9SFY3_9BACI|nr:cobyric acid synthase [Salipaludibacillus aurantiacus]SER83119.1 adenosylcobyric acid synthase [Salipaludibacillus aurantiacus]